VPSITAPVLYITATTDSLCPPDVIADAVAATQDARQKVMRCTHFDVYNGELFEEAVAEETAFFVQHLAPGTTVGGGARAPDGVGAAAEAEAAADLGRHTEL